MWLHYCVRDRSWFCVAQAKNVIGVASASRIPTRSIGSGGFQMPRLSELVQTARENRSPA